MLVVERAVDDVLDDVLVLLVVTPTQSPGPRVRHRGDVVAPKVSEHASTAAQSPSP